MFIISLGDFITKEHAFSVKKKKKKEFIPNFQFFFFRTKVTVTASLFIKRKMA